MKFKCNCGKRFVLKDKKDKNEKSRLMETIKQHLMEHFEKGEIFEVVSLYPCTYKCTNCGKEFHKGFFRTKKNLAKAVREHLSPQCNEVVPKVFITD